MRSLDWNETHIYNPNWPGHARFHNGQTMSMGVCLGIGTLWKTFLANNDRLLTASVFASMYYVTQASAIFYPGSTAYDPPQQFEIENPQIFVIVPNLAMVVVAYVLEQQSAGALRKGKEA